MLPSCPNSEFFAKSGYGQANIGYQSTLTIPSLHVLLNRSSGIFCAKKFAYGISWSRFPGIVMISNTSRLAKSKEQKETSNTTDSYHDHHLSCHILSQSIIYHSTNSTQCYTNELDNILYNDIGDYRNCNKQSNNTNESKVNDSG